MIFNTYQDIYFQIIDCRTIGGPKINMPCMTPWGYKDKIYHGCTWEFNAITAKKPYCPTKIDDNGKLVTRNWGYCDLECTGMY